MRPRIALLCNSGKLNLCDPDPGTFSRRTRGSSWFVVQFLTYWQTKIKYFVHNFNWCFHGCFVSVRVGYRTACCLLDTFGYSDCSFDRWASLSIIKMEDNLRLNHSFESRNQFPMLVIVKWTIVYTNIPIAVTPFSDSIIWVITILDVTIITSWIKPKQTGFFRPGHNNETFNWWVQSSNISP